MVDKYVPKVGDKVRATLGENVLVGEVTLVHIKGDWFDLEIPGASDGLTIYAEDGWKVEQLVSVPTKFGAVIRRADGALFSRSSDFEKNPWIPNARQFSVGDEFATHGGFTVLFDGVDE